MIETTVTSTSWLRQRRASSGVVMPVCSTFVVAWLVLAVPASAAGLWQWTDGAGNVHKSRTVDEIPADFRSGATQLDDKPSSAPSTAKSTTPESTVPGTKKAPLAARPTSAPAAPAPAAAPDANPGGGAVDVNGHGRDWWQARVLDARKQVADAEKAVDHLRAERTHTPLVSKERERRADLSKADAELQAAKKVLTEDLPREARAAAAPRWWLDVK